MNKGFDKNMTKGLSIMTALCLLSGTASFADTKTATTTSAWDKSVLGSNKGYTIEKKYTADVTGDGKNDTIYLLAHKFDKSDFYRDHYKIAVVDHKKNSMKQTILPENVDGGYDASLILADVFGSKAKEVLLVSNTGGSGGIVNFAAYTYDSKGLKLLMDSDKSYKTTEITGVFKDGYQVDIAIKGMNKKFTIDAKDRKPFYEEGKLYIDGKVAKPEKPEFAITPWGGAPSLITVKPNKQTGKNDIIWLTVVKGIANADSLAQIEITWTADKKGMKAVGTKLEYLAVDTPEVAPTTPAATTTEVNAETKAYPELEKKIIDEFDIPKDYYSKTRYYYNYVDLNGDGIDEVFAVVVGPYTSGTGGSSAMILANIKGKLEVNQTLTLINTPVIISDKVTKGCKEIIVRRSGGGAVPSYVVLTCSDGNYTSVNDGKEIKNLDGVKGKAIINNDMAKDLESETALTLSGK